MYNYQSLAVKVSDRLSMAKNWKERKEENVVRAISHQDLQSQIIGFYQGNKESKKTVVKEYFDKQTTLSGATVRIPT